MPAQKLTLPNLITVFVVALVGAAGGNYGTSLWRADSFTGTQGWALADRIDRLEKGLPPAWLIERIDRIEDKVEANSQFCEDMARKMKH